MVSNNTTHWAGTASSEGWSRLLPPALLVAVFLCLYAPVLSQLASDWWQDADYSHGFLIPWLSAYFAWQRRAALWVTVPLPNSWGISLLLLGLVVLFLGRIGAELFLMRVSMIIVLGGLVLYPLGWAQLKVLAFPLTFLLFMIPIPALILNVVTFPLQLMAASLSTSGLQLIGLPVYREGNLIFLPRLTLEVVEACSGIRSLVSLAAVAVVMAHLTQRRLWKQAVLVVSAVPIAIAVNAFRIWGTGVLAYPYGAKVAQDFYHMLSGWLIFVVAFGLLLAESFVLFRLRLKRGRSEEVNRR
jgi:exosortase